MAASEDKETIARLRDALANMNQDYMQVRERRAHIVRTIWHSVLCADDVCVYTADQTGTGKH